MRRRERAQEGGLPLEIPAIDAGGGTGGLGDGAKRRAGCGVGRAGSVGAGHRGRMTRGGGCRKGYSLLDEISRR